MAEDHLPVALECADSSHSYGDMVDYSGGYIALSEGPSEASGVQVVLHTARHLSSDAFIRWICALSASSILKATIDVHH